MRIYEKLITDDKVDLLLAPWGTPFHIAIAPVLEKFKFPMVGNTAASVALRQVKPGYIWFPTSAIPDRIGVELTAMLKAQNVKSAAVLTNVLPFTKEIKNFLEPELKKAGIEVKLSTEYPPDIKDMTSMLTQVKQANPDAVLALAYPGDSVLYAKQAKELGINSAVPVRRDRPERSPSSPRRSAPLGRRRRHHRALDAARRVEGLAGLLRRLRQEVRRGPGLPEFGARLDVARDPASRRSPRPASTRRRSAR